LLINFFKYIKNYLTKLAVILAHTLISAEANAIIRHHTCEDSLYLNEGSKYPGVGIIYNQTAYCTAFLITIEGLHVLNGHLIMSAAHCLPKKEDTTYKFSATLNDAITTYHARVISSFPHPNAWNDGILVSKNDFGFALIYPGLPLTPLPLREHVNTPELQNKLMKTVGVGATGQGNVNIAYNDKRRRTARNILMVTPEQKLLTEFNDNVSEGTLPGLPFFGDCGAPGLIDLGQGEQGCFFIQSLAHLWPF